MGVSQICCANDRAGAHDNTSNEDALPPVQRYSSQSYVDSTGGKEPTFVNMGSIQGDSLIMQDSNNNASKRHRNKSQVDIEFQRMFSNTKFQK